MEHQARTFQSSEFPQLFRWKYVIIITAAVVCVYAQTLRFGFVNYDDDKLIYNNTSFLSHWGNVGTAFTSHAFIGAGGESVYYRPLLMVSYIVDYHLWDLNPVGYHLINVILHAITAIGVFMLVVLMVDEEFPALCAAIIFALHPVQTEAVAWIAGRNDVLLGFFVLYMVVLYLLSTRNPMMEQQYLRLSALAFLLALFTKESAAFYLLLLPLIDVAVRSRPIQELISISYIKKFWMMAATLVLYLAVRVIVFGEVIGAERLYGHRSMIERLSNIPAIVAEHIKLLIIPLNLSVAHPLLDLIWFRAAWNVVATIVIVSFVGLVRFSWKRDKVICLGLLWIAIGLVPVLGIIPVPIPILEHRLYVPMMGFSIAASRAIWLLGVQFQQPAFVKSAVIVVGVVLATASFVRLPVWQNGVTLFSDAIEKAPAYTPSYFSLAGAYYETKRYDEAINTMKQYTTLEPTDLRGYLFFRELYYITHQYLTVAEISRRMIRLDPGDTQRYLEAGVMYEELHLLDTAASIFREGVARHGNSDDLHFRLGVVSQRLGNTDEAEREFLRVIQLNPTSPEAYTVLGKLYYSQGQPKKAIAILESGLAIDQPSRELIDVLHSVYLEQGDRVKAQELSKRYP